MKLLITGVAGFIGSHLVDMAIDKGYEVFGIDAMLEGSNSNNLRRDVFFKQMRVEDLTTSQFKDWGIESCISVAALSNVDTSIKDPRAFESNVSSASNMAWLATQLDIPLVHVSCYDEITRALTPEGLKTYSELKEGDTVFSLNSNFELEETKISKVIINDYVGDMVKFTGTGPKLDLLVTPNHRMYYETSSGDLAIKRADQFTNKHGNKVSRPKNGFRGVSAETYNIPEYGEVNLQDLMFALGCFIGDGFCDASKRTIKNKSGLSKAEYMKSRAASSGRFVSIAARGYQETTESITYRNWFKIPTNKPCRKHLEEVLTGFNLKWKAYDAKAGQSVYFSSKPFHDLFTKCGKGAVNKQIPEEFLKYSTDILRYLWNGLIGTDGTKDGRSFSTSSPRLAIQMCELALKMGFIPRVTRREPKPEGIWSEKLQRTIFSKLTNYTIHFSKCSYAIGRHVETQPYSGKVWCVTVPGNKNLVVERNGCFILSGNTDEEYGPYRPYPNYVKYSKHGKQFLDQYPGYDEEKSLDPTSAYAASKASSTLMALSYFKTFGAPIMVSRGANTYGTRQQDKLIPTICKKVLSGEPVPIFKTPAKREWLHVLDHCSALLTILEKGKAGEIYNVSSGEQRSPLEILKLLSPYAPYELVPDRKGYDLEYKIDSSKIRDTLGWEPVYHVDEHVPPLLNWYTQAFLQGYYDK